MCSMNLGSDLAGKAAQYFTKSQKVKINPEKLGYIHSDGSITFRNAKTAQEYAKNRVVDAIKSDEPFERMVGYKDNRILFDVDGTCDSVEFPEQISERMFSEDVKRDIDVVHGHPDCFGKGKTTPLSILGADVDNGMLNKLKSITAYNTKGEHNTVEYLGNNYDDILSDMLAEYNIQILKKFLPEEKIAEFQKAIDAQKAYRKAFASSELPSDDTIMELQKLSKRANEIMVEVAPQYEAFRSSEEGAKFLHDFYMRNMHKFKCKYSTNFSNYKSSL